MSKLTNSGLFQVHGACFMQGTSQKGKTYYCVEGSRFPGAYARRLYFSFSPMAKARMLDLAKSPFKGGSLVEVGVTFDDHFEPKVETVTVIEEGPGEAKAYVIEKQATQGAPAPKGDEPKGDGTYAPVDLE